MAASIIENGGKREQIYLIESVENCRKMVEDFDGNVLLKGSRKYKLEEILPEWAVDLNDPVKSRIC